MWIARKDMDSDVAARYRKGIEAAAVWANDRSNDAESAKILAKYDTGSSRRCSPR